MVIEKTYDFTDGNIFSTILPEVNEFSTILPEIKHEKTTLNVSITYVHIYLHFVDKDVIKTVFTEEESFNS